MTISVLGAGAFGTALAIALSARSPVTLWGRNAALCGIMQERRKNPSRLPGCTLPAGINVTSDLESALTNDVIVLAIPMQELSAFVRSHDISEKTAIACCKGMDLETGRGPSDILKGAQHSAVLTGPSFAIDIARGLPTALTLACADEDVAVRLQNDLASKNLRLYRTHDVKGAELGGALKNVIAIGCGAVIGGGLGESARAALMTRGFAEMLRVGRALGAASDTMMGLSGFGDLVLTCSSEKSRNYQFGVSLGKGEAFDSDTTVEGAATAQALIEARTLDLPVCHAIADLVAGRIDIAQATDRLLLRPLGEE